MSIWKPLIDKKVISTWFCDVHPSNMLLQNIVDSRHSICILCLYRALGNSVRDYFSK